MLFLLISDFFDLMNLDSYQYIAFIKYKQEQYEIRRQKIHQMCQKVKNKQLLKSLHNPRNNSIPNIIFDPVHQLAYCQIPKVFHYTGSCNMKLQISKIQK